MAGTANNRVGLGKDFVSSQTRGECRWGFCLREMQLSYVSENIIFGY